MDGRTGESPPVQVGLVCPAYRPYRHPVVKNPKWLPSLHDPGHMRLWRIGYALAVCFAAAVAGLALLWWVALVLLHHPALSSSHVISVHDTVGVAQLVFASVAGAGALVALVVAYRRQRVGEDAASHERTRVFNERFTAIATQLGDKEPAVRLAGVHAMAGLADDWKENRQTCIDVLCAYLRLPYDPDPGEDAAPADRAAYQANREVRHTIIRLIVTHLRPDVAVSWEGLDLDFTGAVFDGGDFTGARFSGGTVRFNSASFSDGHVNFDSAEFCGAHVIFDYAEFSGGRVDFRRAKFSGGSVDFEVAEFSGGEVTFFRVEFSGGRVNFGSAKFYGGRVAFQGAEFSAGEVGFWCAEFSGSVSFESAKFSGGKVSFGSAEFHGGQVNFNWAEFPGAEVDFDLAEFHGGQVDFGRSRDWSRPPRFDRENAPAGVTLPADAAAKQA